MQPKPTLFLDRDGVLNRRLPGDYVRHPDAFVPMPGALEALRLLAAHFQPILVVTNQAGIGKGLMTETDLAAVHQKLQSLTASAGGRIDAIYYCPHRTDEGCSCRKPATGMALLASVDFPEIDFSNAWMVGDSASDIRFGQRLGMKTALVAGKWEDAEALAALTPDGHFESLLAFASFWVSGLEVSG